ncbi:MAG TPA: hypothetical protein VJ739_11675, partial [Gemmataceae bacterium]|nr:hypothetical protein [Gemmataceae bacterium]
YIDEDDLSTPFNFYTAADSGNAPGFNIMATSPNPTGANELLQYWVFGTELPRVVLNEVYAEYQQPTMPGAPRTGTSGTFNVRVWAELYNPLPAGGTPPGAQPLDANPVPLYVRPPGPGPGYAPYQVVVASTNNAANSRGLLLPAAGQNVLGTPDTASAPGQGVRALSSDADFNIANTPLFGGGNSGNLPSLAPQDVLVLGPTPDPALVPAPGSFVGAGPGGPDVGGTINVNAASTPNGQVPSGKQYVTTSNMQYPVQVTYMGGYGGWKDPAMPGTPKDDRYNAPNGGITVLLRRLTNPYLPHQTDPTAGDPYSGNYNPYMTVDHMEHVSLNDYTPLPLPYMPAFPAARPTTTPARPSRGKLQPYAADFSQISDEANPSSVATQQVPTVHNLGVTPNSPTPPNYDWLVHLDRQLISPAELLQVSAYPPFLLTHQFITKPGGATVKFTHRAPWFDEANLGVTTPGNSTRLYRALEFLDVHSRAAGVGFTGRVPGRVNINTIWDQETFNALCDPQAGNYFTAADVSAIWAGIQASRQNPGPGASPFMGMGVPNSPGGDPWFTSSSGIGNTLLRTASGAPAPLFQVTNASATHPYQQDELLTKILNNVTTRSNVFAIWVTVGFFPVVQDTDSAGNQIRPVKLGAEIGASTNTNIRHRMFAIVDRSAMAIDQQVTTLSAAVAPANPPGPVNLPLAATNGVTANTGINWSIGPGTILLVGTGASKEAVLVTSNGAQLQAIFQLPHASGTAVTIPGNPGPQPGFSVHSATYADVVPYFAIMQ